MLMEFTQSLGSKESSLDYWFILKINQHWYMLPLDRNGKDYLFCGAFQIPKFSLHSTLADHKPTSLTSEIIRFMTGCFCCSSCESVLPRLVRCPVDSISNSRDNLKLWSEFKDDIMPGAADGRWSLCCVHFFSKPLLPIKWFKCSLIFYNQIFWMLANKQNLNVFKHLFI